MRERASNGLDRQRWRWIAGVLVVLVAAIYVSAWINDDVEGGDWWGMHVAQGLTLWLAAFVAGCIIRQRLAVLLALLPIVVAIPFGLQEDGGGFIDPHPVAVYLAALAPIAAAFIAGGVVLSAVADQFLRRRTSARVPT